ncbi:hypothetical protein XENOCAPTIV_017307, partial [Xenoophorus captivus]
MDSGGSVVSMRAEEQPFHVRYRCSMCRCCCCYKARKAGRMEVSCLELALEGERLCKVGDYSAGVSFFEAAIQVGTEDLQVLSAIYSQLGNAYFHLHDYAKALEFHRHDLTLTRANLAIVKELGDQAAQGRTYGNLGNTHYLLGNFGKATGDRSGELTARMNVSDLQMVLGLSYSTNNSTLMSRRHSMENLELMKLTPDKMNVRT